jgi:hypothetical protein
VTTAPTPNPTSAPKPGSPSADATNVSPDAQVAGGGVPFGTTGTKAGLDGRPVGSPIFVGQTPGRYVGGQLEAPVAITKQTQYTTTSAAEQFAGLSNRDKANLLAKLAQIPGIYKDGTQPTGQSLLAMGNAIAPRKEDIDALTKVMRYSDSVGEDYQLSVDKFFTNKALAASFFSVRAAQGPSLTPSAALISELNTQFMDIFNAGADKKVAAAYAKEVQQLEAKQKGSISAQQREDIRLKYIQNAAATRYKTAMSTPDTKDDALLQEGALGMVVNQIRTAYTNSGVPIIEAEIYKKGIQGVRSEQALANILNVTRQQAKALYPGFKDLIDQGAEVSDLVAPYASVYSQIYGKPTSQMKPADFYEVAAGDKALSPAEYKKILYAKPEFKDTETYKNTKQGALTAIVRAFGIGPA